MVLGFVIGDFLECVVDVIVHRLWLGVVFCMIGSVVWRIVCLLYIYTVGEM